MTLLTKIEFTKSLLSLIPNWVNSVRLSKRTLELTVSAHDLKKVLLFLKNNNKCQFSQLIDICAIDFLGQKSNRFALIYNLLSLHWGARLTIRVELAELDSINSVVDLFPSADWLEREVWDTFGVFFKEHPDLRRILTDYGFEGYPLRKDFPQTGFVEVRYDTQKKHVLYEPIEFAQEYRFFNYNNPWLQLKN